MSSVGGRVAAATSRMFVSNLPWTIGTTELRAFGSKFGRVTHATVIFDKNTGLSKGYGFLVFADKDGGVGMLQTRAGGHFLEGNYVTCAPAYNNNISH